MMRKQSDTGFTWRAAEKSSSSRRAIAAGILAASCIVIGFIGSRLSGLVFPPSAPSQPGSVATIPPISKPPILPKSPEVSAPSMPVDVAPARSEAKPVDTPSPVVVINPGSAEAGPDAAEQSTEGPAKSEVRADAELPNSLPKTAPQRSAPSIEDRARNYSDLRRFMLDH
jgi:hypothetical protein